MLLAIYGVHVAVNIQRGLKGIGNVIVFTLSLTTFAIFVVNRLLKL